MDELHIKRLIDLVAEITNVDIDDVAGELLLLVVEVLPYIRARDDLPGTQREVVQQGVFARGERDRAAAALNCLAEGVDLKVADANNDTGLAMGTADEGADPRQQFIPVKRLDQIIIGAQIEPFDPVFGCVTSCQAQNRGPIATLPRLIEHRPSFLAGQHDVEDDAVVLIAGKQMRGLVSVESEIDRVSLFAQSRGDGARQLGMIFGNQQFHGLGSLSTPRSGEICKSPRQSRSSMIKADPSTRTAFIFLRLCHPGRVSNARTASPRALVMDRPARVVSGSPVSRQS